MQLNLFKAAILATASLSCAEAIQVTGNAHADSRSSADALTELFADLKYNEYENSCIAEAAVRQLKEKNHCPAGYEKSGLACFKKCKPGYSGVLHLCWQDCPADFTNAAAWCAKEGTYTREGSWSKHDQYVEQFMLMYFPTCKAGFKPFGANCIKICPNKMTDLGLTCSKDSYDRGAGISLQCAPGEEELGTACVDPCGGDQEAYGLTCKDPCPEGTTSCTGGNLCLDNNASCKKYVTDRAGNIGDVITGSLTLDFGKIARATSETSFDLADTLKPCP